MITFNNFFELSLLGAAGALAMEILKAYELRAKLHAPAYAKLRRSWLFWLATVAFIMAAGFLTWVFHENNPNVSVVQLVGTGAGASALLKKITETINANKSLSAGDNTTSTLSDMFK